MISYLLIGLAVALILLMGVIATRPATFRVTRGVSIAAPAAAPFAQVNVLRNWDAWSPWAKRDPNMKMTYAGPAEGEGASYAWEGNNQVGSGRMTISESRPGEMIRIRLEFLKPFKATNTAEFIFKEENGATLITWSMDGNNSFIGKLMSLIMNMDKMIGGDFETGLAGIKAIVESRGK